MSRYKFNKYIQICRVTKSFKAKLIKKYKYSMKIYVLYEIFLFIKFRFRL